MRASPSIDELRQVANTPDELGLLGTEIDGRYRLDRFIGAGTMGAVYEGTQLAVGRPVAVKLLNAALKTQQEVRDRFRIEAQAIATLSHPNCVTLYDFGWAAELGALFMAVEFLDGRGLDQLVEDGLSTTLALTLSRQIADVLAIAHAAGIMHRDLKPENVMVVEGTDGSAQAKVLDFGLARIFEDASGSTRLTRQGQLFGTPAYMSPEQCRSAMDVGPPADIYALGVSMFEMITGSLPFNSSNVPELLILHSTKTAPRVPVDGDVPPAVSDLIARMLEKDVLDRPTAGDVVAVLSAVLEGRPVPALSPMGNRKRSNSLESAQTFMSPPTTSQPETRGGMNRLGIAAVVAIVALLGVIAVLVAGNNRSEATPASVALQPIEPPTPAPAAPTNNAEDEIAVASDLAFDSGAILAGESSARAESIVAATNAQATKLVKSRKVVEVKPKAKTSKRKKFQKLGFSYE